MELTDDMVLGNTEFKIFTGLLKASRSSDGKMRLHGVASSTTRDLHGDVMSASAIDDMERAANNNLTIFLNHSYNVPEDVGGSVERAKSMVKGVDQDGNPNIDLNLDIAINDTNPRAVQTFEAIERGTKLGLSIGAMIPEGGARRNKDGTYLIDHVDLLETSIVGIPANPRSWVEYAVKAIKKGGKDRTTTIPLGEPTLTLDDSSYTITGSLDGISMSPVVTNGVSDNVSWTWSTPDNITIDHITMDPTDPVEPVVQDAQVTIIQIDTSDGDAASDDAPGSSQEAAHEAEESSVEEAVEEASEAENEAGLLDETGDGDDEALGDSVTRDATPYVNDALADALRTIREMTRSLVDARAELAEAKTAAASAATAQKLAEEEKQRVLRDTQQILERLADAPLIRKSVIRDAQSDFRSRFEGIYSDDFLAMLERNQTNE